jgi:hypothetical protein
VKHACIDRFRHETAGKRDRRQTGVLDEDRPGLQRLLQGHLSADPQATFAVVEARFWARAPEILEPRLGVDWLDVFRQYVLDGVKPKTLAKERGYGGSAEYQRFQYWFKKYQKGLARLLRELGASS